MNIKPYVFALVGMLATASLAFAENDQSTTPPPSVPKSIKVTTSGSVTLEGRLSAINTATGGTSADLEIDSWHGPWIINVAAANLLRKDRSLASIEEFQVGDYLRVSAYLPSTTADQHLDAWRDVTGALREKATVRDMSIITSNVRVYGSIKGIRPAETDTNPASGSLILEPNVTLNVNAPAYLRSKEIMNVKTSTRTYISFKKLSIPFGDLKAGDQVSVSGKMGPRLRFIEATSITKRVVETTPPPASPATPPSPPSSPGAAQ